MRRSPFGKRATDAAVAGYVEAGGEFAHVVQNQEAAGRECGIPKIELSQSRSILVRAVQDDQVGIAAKIFPGCFYRGGLERIAFGDLDEILKVRARDPSPRHFAHR